MHLVFWQPIPSFHQEGFFRALAAADWVSSVTLKYESDMPLHRRNAGWRQPVFGAVDLQVIQDGEVPVDSPEHVHIFTGFKTHRRVWSAFGQMPASAQSLRYCYAEVPEMRGFSKWLRLLKYRYAFRQLQGRLNGILALGNLGVEFYRSVTGGAIPVHSFAYYDVLEREIVEASPGQEGISDSPFRVLYVGQLIRRKGVDRLLDALSRVGPGKSWVLDVYGNGAQKNWLMERSRKLNIAEYVNWFEPVPSSSLRSIYQNADLLVLPSRWDGWGMTVNEAMRAGCPVLVAPTTGVSSAVPEGDVLPSSSLDWHEPLSSRIREGKANRNTRALYQNAARRLSGEFGADQLRSIIGRDLEL